MRPFSKKFCVGLVIAGIALNVLYWLAAETRHLCTGKFLLPSDFIFDYWKLPSMMIGFVMFLLFEKHHFSSKVVNWIAGSAFGVYLIHYHPVCHELWSTYLPVKTLFAYRIQFSTEWPALLVFSFAVYCLIWQDM